MRFHKIQFLAAIVLCCWSVGFSVPADKFEQRLRKKYILKYNLILIGHLPKIFPDNIIFTEGCNEAAYLTSRQQILYKGIEVEPASMEKAGKFLKLTLKTQKESFQALLANRSSRELQRSFDLILAEKWDEKEADSACDGCCTTKSQVINCIGFPILACKQGRTERLFYDLWFAGKDLYGFDTWWIEIKDGKVVNVGGSI
jgi:hypothetical protein